MIQVERLRAEVFEPYTYFVIRGTEILHNENGPAIIYDNGNYRAWLINGKYHRTDGPARVWIIDRIEEYEFYLNGKYLQSITTTEELIIYNILH